MKIWFDSHGYPLIYINGAKIAQHVHIAETALGRKMPKGAEVHHFDENPKNNENTNLVICENRAYHCLLHVRQRIFRRGGDPDTQRICEICHELKLFADFYRNYSKCKECQRAIQRIYDTKRRTLGKPYGKKRMSLREFNYRRLQVSLEEEKVAP